MFWKSTENLVYDKIEYRQKGREAEDYNMKSSIERIGL